MAQRLSILIVEDEMMIARSLAFAVEAAGAGVVGPVDSAADALALIDIATVDAAILDVTLVDRDITPVARALIDRTVPFILHTGTRAPDELAADYPGLPVILKPVAPAEVMACLISEIFRER